MAKFLRQQVSPDALVQHIWYNTGGSSVDLLRQLLVQDPRPVISNVAFDPPPYRAMLKKYGPLLVSTFEVHDDFLNCNNSVHLGEPTGDSKVCTPWCSLATAWRERSSVFCSRTGGRTRCGSHSCLPPDSTLLMQPFVEVDADYLEACGVGVYAVKTPQLAMGQFPTNPAQHVETELLDAPENYRKMIW
jgi:hypothetical protein